MLKCVIECVFINIDDFVDDVVVKCSRRKIEAFCLDVSSTLDLVDAVLESVGVVDALGVKS